MSTHDEQGAPGESFAALFEAEAGKKNRTGTGLRLSPGAPVEGVVVRVGRDAVFLELDGKTEGYIELSELLDPEGKPSVAVGDTVRAIVVNVSDDDGVVRLGKVMPKGRGAEGMMAAMETQLPVDGLVTGVNKGGLEVTVDGVRAFCPARQVDLRYTADLAPLVGQRLKFMVVQVKEGGREVVLSRRAVLEREAGETRAKMAGQIVPGAVLRGRVVSTRDFGAFVDLGGVEALLPTSEISHDRSLRASEVVKVGDEVDVQVLRVEPDEKKPGQTKITLSLKALAADPWESAASVVEEGSVREGRVVRVAQFGAFVQLAPGLDGLLHVSEVGEADGKPRPMPQVGDTVSVRVLKVDPGARRISLAAIEGGATARRQAAKSLVAGMVVNGKVSGVMQFGVFVQIDGGPRGLVPAQELVKARGQDLAKAFPIGTPVRAKIVSIDPAGKIRLSVSALEADEERASFEDFRVKEQDRASSKLGALGQKLAQAGLLGGGAGKPKGKRK